MFKPKRTIVIGDIHGCYYTLKELLAKINYSSVTDLLVFLGDYIDRGWFSYDVVQNIRTIQRQLGTEKVIALKGNHEDLAVKATDTCDNFLWLYNGGMNTVESYERNGTEVSLDVNWFRHLPLYYENDYFIICHAGLCEEQIDKISEEDMLWNRDWITQQISIPNGKSVIFGHTPIKTFSTYRAINGSLCIDTGCVRGGSLTAAIVNEDVKTIEELEIVSCPKVDKDNGVF